MPSYNRLLAYTHMFKENALKEFEQLASSSSMDSEEEQSNLQFDVSSRGRDGAGDDHIDNDQGAVELEGFTRTTTLGSMVDKLNEMTQTLE